MPRLPILVASLFLPMTLLSAQTPSQQYSYDAVGNMTSAIPDGIQSISYNELNLPEVVTLDAGNVRRIEQLYSADGEKLERDCYDQSGARVSHRSYVGPLVLEDGVPVMLLVDGGYISIGTQNGYSFVGNKDSDILKHMGITQSIQTQSFIIKGAFPVDVTYSAAAKSNYTVTSSISPHIVYNKEAVSTNNILGKEYCGLALNVSVTNIITSFEDVRLSVAVEIASGSYIKNAVMSPFQGPRINPSGASVFNFEDILRFSSPEMPPLSISVLTTWYINTGSGRVIRGLKGSLGVVSHYPFKTVFYYGSNQ